MSRLLEPIGSSLEKIVGASLKCVPAGEGPVLAWPLACGSLVSARTRVVEFRDGILCIEVADRSWRAELQALAPQYLAVINRYVAENVNRIEFVVAERGR